MTAPDRGDLVILNFDPQIGHEQAKRRPALVVSPIEFNEAFGLAFVAPITTKPRGHAFEIALPADCDVRGVILTHQTKSLDWRARNLKISGKASSQVVHDVVQLLKDVLEG